MKTPRWLLKNTAMYAQPVVTTDLLNSQVTNYVVDETKSIRCNLQPISADVAELYDRETASTLFVCRLAPTDSTGGAVAVTHDQRMQVDGVIYAVDGNSVVPAGNGALIRVRLKQQKPVTP